LLPEHFLPPSIDTLKKFDIHDIYFAGDWQNALVLIRELNAIQQKSGTGITLNSIILSDSSATQNLLDHSKFDLANSENNSLSQPQPNNSKPQSRKSKPQSRKNIKIYVISAFDARYTPIDTEASKYYAQRTFTIIKRIVEKTNENIKNSRDILSNPWWNIKTYFNIILDALNKSTFKIHRASDARKQIIKTIENDVIVNQISIEYDYKFENAKLGEPDYRCRIFK
jgi:hypothetical protein